MNGSSGEGYSLEKALRFNWSSVSGTLNPERRALVDEYVRGPNVLDAGCGGGGYVAYLQKQGCHAAGVDLHDEFLAEARKKHPECDFYAGNLADLPFRDGQFDTALCFDVLEHVADDCAAVRELARVSSRRLVLAVPAESGELRAFNVTYLHYEDVTHVRYYTAESLRRLVESAAPGARVRIIPHLHIPSVELALHLLGLRQSGSPSGSDLADPMHAGVVSRLLGRLRRRSRLPNQQLQLAQTLRDLSPPKLPTAFAAIVDLDRESMSTSKGGE